jgi:hypothetical protein
MQITTLGIDLAKSVLCGCRLWCKKVSRLGGRGSSGVLCQAGVVRLCSRPRAGMVIRRPGPYLSDGPCHVWSRGLLKNLLRASADAMRLRVVRGSVRPDREGRPRAPRAERRWRLPAA